MNHRDDIMPYTDEELMRIEAEVLGKPLKGTESQRLSLPQSMPAQIQSNKYISGPGIQTKTPAPMYSDEELSRIEQEVINEMRQKPLQPQPLQPQIQPEKQGKKLSIPRFLAESAGVAATSTLETGLRAIRGGDEDIAKESFIDKPIKWAEERGRRYVEKYTKSYYPWLVRQIAEAVPSLGYSGAVAATALPAGIAATITTGGGGMPAAIAAGTTTAWRATRDRKLSQLFEIANNSAMMHRGKPLSNREWKEIVEKNDYQNLANKTASYEAFPEMISLALGFKLLTLGGKGVMTAVLGKKAAEKAMSSAARTKIAKELSRISINRLPKTLRPLAVAAGRMGAVMTEEQLQELYTNYNQELLDYKAGLRKDKPKWDEVLAEQFPQVAIVTGILGTGAFTANKAYTKITGQDVNLDEEVKKQQMKEKIVGEKITREEDIKQKITKIADETVKAIKDKESDFTVADGIKVAKQLENKGAVEDAAKIQNAVEEITGSKPLPLEEQKELELGAEPKEEIAAPPVKEIKEEIVAPPIKEIKEEKITVSPTEKIKEEEIKEKEIKEEEKVKEEEPAEKLSENEKELIRGNVIELGSIESVNQYYGGDNDVDIYARELAREIYKGPLLEREAERIEPEIAKTETEEKEIVQAAEEEEAEWTPVKPAEKEKDKEAETFIVTDTSGKQYKFPKVVKLGRTKPQWNVVDNKDGTVTLTRKTLNRDLIKHMREQGKTREEIEAIPKDYRTYTYDEFHDRLKRREKAAEIGRKSAFTKAGKGILIHPDDMTPALEAIRMAGNYRDEAEYFKDFYVGTSPVNATPLVKDTDVDLRDKAESYYEDMVASRSMAQYIEDPIGPTKMRWDDIYQEAQRDLYGYAGVLNKQDKISREQEEEERRQYSGFTKAEVADRAISMITEKMVESINTTFKDYLDKANTKAKTEDITAIPPGQEDRVDQKLARIVGNTFGLNVLIVHINDRAVRKLFNGLYITDDLAGKTVVLNSDADNNHFAVLAHEIAHDFKRNNPLLWYDVLDVISEDAQAIEKYKEVIKKTEGGEYAGIDYLDEFAADIISERMSQPEFWEKLYKNKDTRNFVLKFRNKLKKYIDRLNFNPAYKASKYFKEKKQIQKVYDTIDNIIAINIKEYPPEQVEQGEEAIFQTTRPNISFQARRQDFQIPEKESYVNQHYNKIERTLENKLSNKNLSSLVKSNIKAMLKKGDIKKEEIEWSNLLDDPESPVNKKDKVTKKEVLDWLRQNNIRVHEVVLKDLETEDSIYIEPGDKYNYRELRFTIPEKPDDVYEGPRQDVKNIIAHIRVDDRIYKDSKILFVEEIQSDWQKEGIKEEYEAREIPEAPFEKSWTDLALKRIFRLATEEGYDKIAWTTDNMQSKRWEGKKFNFYDTVIVNKANNILKKFNAKVKKEDIGLSEDVYTVDINKDMGKVNIEQGFALFQRRMPAASPGEQLNFLHELAREELYTRRGRTNFEKDKRLSWERIKRPSFLEKSDEPYYKYTYRDGGYREKGRATESEMIEKLIDLQNDWIDVKYQKKLNNSTPNERRRMLEDSIDDIIATKTSYEIAGNKIEWSKYKGSKGKTIYKVIQYGKQEIMSYSSFKKRMSAFISPEVGLDGIEESADKIKSIDEQLAELKEQMSMLRETGQANIAEFDIKQHEWFANKSAQMFINQREKIFLQAKLLKILGDKWYGSQKVKDWSAAIMLYIDLKNNPDHYTKFRDSVPEDFQRWGDMAQQVESNPDMKRIADYIELSFSVFGLDATGAQLDINMQEIVNKQELLKAEVLKDPNYKFAVENYLDMKNETLTTGIIHNLINNYMNRLWKVVGVGDNIAQGSFARFAPKTRHAKRRVFTTIYEGLATERTDGGKYELQITDVFESLHSYKDEIAQTTEDKRLIQTLLKIKNKDGSDLFTYERKPGYSVIEHPNFKPYVFERHLKDYDPIKQLKKSEREDIYNRIAEGESPDAVIEEYIKEPLISGRDYIITNNGNIMIRKQVYAPKQIADRLNNVLSRSKLYEIHIGKFKPIGAITRFNQTLKSIILFTSLFHHQAFMRSYLFGVRHKKWSWEPTSTGKWYNLWGIGGEWNVFDVYKRGIDYMDSLEPHIIRGVRNGLTLGRNQDWKFAIARADKNIIQKYIDRIAKEKPEFARVKEKVESLWDKQHTFLFEKFGAGLKTMAYLKEYQNMLEENPEIDADTASRAAANLVNDDFGGLPIERWDNMSPEIWHMAHLFLLAPDWTLSNVRTMYRGFTADKKEERNLYARFWVSILTKSLGVTVAANLVRAAFDEDEDIVDRYKKAWDSGRLRWLDVEVTTLPVVRGFKKEGKRKYFSVIGHFRDPLKFISHPIVSAKHKGSVVTRIIVDAITGSDWRGQRFTDISEFLGFDDKGVYKITTSKYKRGEPKGGRLFFKTTAPGYAKPTTIEYSQIPSFVVYQLREMIPIVGQQTMAFIQGEIDWFDALTKSIGMYTATAYENPAKLKEDMINNYVDALEKKDKLTMRKIRKAIKDFNERYKGEYKIDLMSAVKSERKTRAAARRLKKEKENE